MNMATKTVFGLIAAAAFTFANVDSASAQCGYGGGYGYGGGVVSIGFGGGGYGGVIQNTSYYGSPIYHGPSVHYDRVYHPTRLHWTPGRGLHTHGHFDRVPHFVPGHFH